MLQNIIFATSVVFPTFVMIFLGYMVIKSKILTRETMDRIGRLCFTYCLSSHVFMELFDSDASIGDSMPLLIFLLIATLITFTITWIIAAKTIKNKNSVGTFVQATFRSSFTVLGLSMVGNLAGNDGIVYASGVLVMTVILYNTLAVLCMSPYRANACTDSAQPQSVRLIPLIKDIFTNPLIVAVILAFLVKVSGLKLPYIATQTVGYMSDMAIPLSLITIGSSLDFGRIKGQLGLAFTAAFIKTFGLAIVIIPLAVFAGFRDLDIAIVAILFTTGNPSASFVMAKSMDGDCDLAATALVLSTLMSIFALTLALYILRSLGLM